MARVAKKKVKNLIIWNDGTITVENVRISYPHLDKKWAKKEGDTPRFSSTFILPEATHKEAIRELQSLMADILKDKGPKGTALKLKASVKFCRDGNEETKPEYENAWIIASGETKRPAVLNRDKTEMDVDDIVEIILPGSRVDALIEPWFQDNEHGQRINASLRGVRYLKTVEDEVIGEGAMSAEEVAGSFGDDDGDEGGFGDGDEGDDDMGGL